MITNKSVKISVASRFKIKNKEFDSPHIVISMADDEEYFPNILEKKLPRNIKDCGLGYGGNIGIFFKHLKGE